MRPASMLAWIASPMRSSRCDAKPASSGETRGLGLPGDEEAPAALAKFECVCDGATTQRENANRTKTANPCQCFLIRPRSTFLLRASSDDLLPLATTFPDPVCTAQRQRANGRRGVHRGAGGERASVHDKEVL